jgi:hypothetical protein
MVVAKQLHAQEEDLLGRHNAGRAGERLLVCPSRGERADRTLPASPRQHLTVASPPVAGKPPCRVGLSAEVQSADRGRVGKSRACGVLHSSIVDEEHAHITSQH